VTELAAKPQNRRSDFDVSTDTPPDGRPVSETEKARVYPGTGRIYVNPTTWAAWDNVQKAGVIAHERAHDENPSENSETAIDRRAGAIMRHEGYSRAAAMRALSSVVQGRATERAVAEGWDAADRELGGNGPRSADGTPAVLGTANRMRPHDGQPVRPLTPAPLVPARSLVLAPSGTSREELAARSNLSPTLTAEAEAVRAQTTEVGTGREVTATSTAVERAAAAPRTEAAARDAAATTAATTQARDDLTRQIVAGVVVVVIVALIFKHRA
jgi:hypothetical protein